MSNLCHGTGHTYLAEPFRSAKETFESFECAGPQLIYTDKCCGPGGDYKFLTEIWPALKCDLQTLQPHPLPSKKDIVYGATHITNKVEEIFQHLCKRNSSLIERGAPIPVGADFEWRRLRSFTDGNQNFRYASRGKVNVCQLAFDAEYFGEGIFSY